MKDETEELIDELIAQLGNKKDLLEAQDKLFKRGVENLLKAELSSHLGYAQYEKTEDKKTNSRNGHSEKTGVSPHTIYQSLDLKRKSFYRGRF